MKTQPIRSLFLPPSERSDPRAADQLLAIYAQGRCPFCVKLPKPCTWCLRDAERGASHVR